MRPHEPLAFRAYVIAAAFLLALTAPYYCEAGAFPAGAGAQAQASLKAGPTGDAAANATLVVVHASVGEELNGKLALRLSSGELVPVKAGNSTLTLRDANVALTLLVGASSWVDLVELGPKRAYVVASAADGLIVVRVSPEAGPNTISASASVSACRGYEWVEGGPYAVRLDVHGVASRPASIDVYVVARGKAYEVPRTAYRLHYDATGLKLTYPCNLPLNYLLTEGRQLVVTLGVNGRFLAVVVDPMSLAPERAGSIEAPAHAPLADRGTVPPTPGPGAEASRAHAIAGAEVAEELTTYTPEATRATATEGTELLLYASGALGAVAVLLFVLAKRRPEGEGVY